MTSSEPRQPGPSFWFHPNAMPALPDVRYLGDAETAKVFREAESASAVSRCDVIQIFSFAEEGGPTGLEDWVERMVDMAVAHGKGIAIEVGGPMGRDPWFTGAQSADRDGLSMAQIEDLGGTVSMLVMDHPIQRVMHGFTSEVLTVSATNPALVACLDHGFVTGDMVYISGTECSPTIDGWRTVTRTDANHFTVPVNVNVFGQDASATPPATVTRSYREAVAQCVEYVQTIHASRPTVDIGYVDQHGNWLVGWGSSNLAQSGGDVYWPMLVSQLAIAGETLSALHVDAPFEYIMGWVEPRTDEYRMLDTLKLIQDAAIATDVPFGLCLNSVFGGGTDLGADASPERNAASPIDGSDELFQQRTLRFAETVRRLIAAGGLQPLDDVIVESWYYFPRSFGPDTTRYSFCDTFLRAKAVMNADVYPFEGG